MLNFINELSNSGAVSDDIFRLKQIFSVEFPDTYEQILLNHNGGYITGTSFSYFDNEFQEIIGGCISSFLKIDNDEYGASVIEVYQTLVIKQKRMPDLVIPFGEDGGGNFSCFDYRNKESPSIMYWIHDYPKETSINFVANSFEEFVNMLYKPED